MTNQFYKESYTNELDKIIFFIAFKKMNGVTTLISDDKPFESVVIETELPLVVRIKFKEKFARLNHFTFQTTDDLVTALNLLSTTTIPYLGESGYGDQLDFRYYFLTGPTNVELPEGEYLLAYVELSKNPVDMR